MRQLPLAATALIAIAVLPANSGHAAPKYPYEGLWATTAKTCRDEDGVFRMEINSNGFFWYESRCRASDVKPAGANAWTMRLACEGEGEKFNGAPRLSLPAPDRLVMEKSPVGQEKRQVYVRCAMPRPKR
jgi:hypothetical protein